MHANIKARPLQTHPLGREKALQFLAGVMRGRVRIVAARQTAFKNIILIETALDSF